MFPFDDVIMQLCVLLLLHSLCHYKNRCSLPCRNITSSIRTNDSDILKVYPEVLLMCKCINNKIHQDMFQGGVYCAVTCARTIRLLSSMGRIRLVIIPVANNPVHCHSEIIVTQSRPSTRK